MNINTKNKQQQLADTLIRYKDFYIVGGLNDYELAGKILSSLEQMEVDELVEERPQTESQEYQNAH